MKNSKGQPIISSLKSGHPRTLLSAFLYFDVSFMVWMLIGALSVLIAKDLHLSAFQKGFLVSVPLLGGAFFRIVLGLLSDRFGPKKVGMTSLLVTIFPLGWAWLGGESFPELLVIALFLGIAGASFAVALPLASRWYPRENQGIAMGIAGAGNSGTLIAVFLAPTLAVTYHFGWHGVFGLAIIPVLTILALFTWLAKEPPVTSSQTGIRPYLELLKIRDLWWFCLFYGTSFGGFVGLTSYLNILYHDHYGLSAIAAGNLTGLAVLSGSFFRPVGGILGDRFGGFRVLIVIYLLVAIAFMLFGAFLPALPFSILLLTTGILALGMGNGAVFQLVPQRFSSQIGVVSGIVGAAGGLGGFFLPSLFGVLREYLNSTGSGFVAFSLIAFFCGAVVFLKRESWEQGWRLVEGVSPEGSGPLSPTVVRVPMEVVFGG